MQDKGGDKGWAHVVSSKIGGDLSGRGAPIASDDYTKRQQPRMCERQEVATWMAWCAAALTVGAGNFIGGAVSSHEASQLPAGPSEGAEVTEVNPAAGTEPKTYIFGNVQNRAGEQARLVDEMTGRTDFTFNVAASRLPDSCPSAWAKCS